MPLYKFVNAHFSGEIGTKGGNRSAFVSKLKSNVRHTLGKSAEKVTTLQERLLISVSASSNAKETAELTSKVFGISWSAPCILTEIDEEKVAQEASKVLKEIKAREFYIIVKRSDKGLKIERSAFGKKVAELITKKTGIEGMINSQTIVNVELVTGNKALIFTGKFPGPGGLPVGSGGKIVLLLSGGIDSPAAAWLLAKRGCEIVFVHFHSFKEIGKEKKKIAKIEALISSLTPWLIKTKCYFVPYYPFQISSHLVPDRYRLLSFRRFMALTSQAIAEKEGAKAIATGESLGQVASQTLSNLASVQESVSLPMLRPLLAYDKQEIIALAQKLGTYEISLQKYTDCCTLFNPSSPATSSHAKDLKVFEEKIKMEKIVTEALGASEIFEYG
ncbi:tRNA sulfurtransferase [Candidatus Gugararchaeum adminiculabundum]|nr:tRNA sulfurtransferase [Candidatus Gugararchaeum adminiculabundum]